MAFPVQVESEVKASALELVGGGLRDFDLAFYDSTTIDESEVRVHVGSYLAEKLLAPRDEQLWIGKDRQLDPEYLAMMQRAIEYAGERGDKKVVKRYVAELTGMQGLVDLVVESGERGEPLPVVVIASDPGQVYIDQEGRKRSSTTVGLLREVQEKGWQYSVLTLPTQYIGLERHWRMVEKLGDIARSERLLARALEEVTADTVVAFPLILDELNHSLDELVSELGYESWDEVEEKAANQLALEGDERAGERREAMIEEFTRRIVLAVEGGASRDAKEALVNAMADVFALEKGAKTYLGMGREQILEEIEKTVQVALADKMGVFSSMPKFDYQVVDYGLAMGGGFDWRELYAYRAWMGNEFRTNSLAREARATGCGGAGINIGGQGNESWFGVSYQNPMEASYAGFDLMQGYGYQETTMTTASEFTSTGKYKEYYDYYRDVCKGPCKSEKPYVAHAKSGATVNGEPVKCAGYCSDCEK